MSDERAAFLTAYDQERVEDQEHYYEARTTEYEASAKQINAVNIILMGLAAICGAAGAVFTDQALWFGLTAAGLSALAAATSTWGDVIGFSANAELYEATRGALAHLQPTQPENPATATVEEVAAYVGKVEDILTGEFRKWGEVLERATAEFDPEPAPPAEVDPEPAPPAEVAPEPEPEPAAEPEPPNDDA